MEREWKSPRQIEAELKAYQLKRFEDYMAQVDQGKLERSIALTALREELEFSDGKETSNQDH